MRTARRLSPIFAVTAALAALACGAPTPDAAGARNVFGPDNREEVRSRAYPYAAIGRLETGCTATLVGRRLALTAAHCVIDEQTGAVQPLLGLFRPNVIDGRSEAEAWVEYVWYGTSRPVQERGKDWAILQLSSPLGDTARWLEVREPDLTRLPLTTNLVGYSIDRHQGRTASVHRGCYVHHLGEGGRLLHDCDGTTGVSGGPMFTMAEGRVYIEALMVSEFRGDSPDSLVVSHYAKDVANVAISSAAFRQVLSALRQSVDAGLAAPVFPDVLAKPNPNHPGGGPVGPDLPDPGDGGGPVDPGQGPGPGPVTPPAGVITAAMLVPPPVLRERAGPVGNELRAVDYHVDQILRLASGPQDADLRDRAQRMLLGTATVREGLGELFHFPTYDRAPHTVALGMSSLVVGMQELTGAARQCRDVVVCQRLAPLVNAVDRAIAQVRRTIVR